MSLYRRPTSPYWWALLEGTDDGRGNGWWTIAILGWLLYWWRQGR